MTPPGEGLFEFCDMSHSFFGMRAISSQKPVLVSFTLVLGGAVVEMVLMLRVLPGFFALGPGLLMIWSLRSNVSFFGCHPILFWTP